MFLKVEYDLMRCEGYHSALKLLISYFYSLQSSGRAFWGSPVYLASLFGTSTAKMEKILAEMEGRGIIERTGEGYVLAMKWPDIIRNGQPKDDGEV